MKAFLSLLLSAAYLLTSDGGRVRIIDGDEVLPHSRPYMALIKLENEKYEEICGGSLIRRNWVLTAAHCQMFQSTVTVILGAHSSEENEVGKQMFDVIRSIKHPHYNKSNLHNDLRLLKLHRRAKLGIAVQLISLPETFEDTERGTVCNTAGWGLTKDGHKSDNLMEVNVTVMEREKCHRLWRDKINITQNMTCTSVGPGGQDTCDGDSGGPLICNGVLRGITSFGNIKCGHPGDASIFTRLTKEYVNWIIKTISD